MIFELEENDDNKSNTILSTKSKTVEKNKA